MNIAQIEKNLKNIITSFCKESFIYDLLLAYGLPKASITRLKKGNLNLSKVSGEVSWKKKLFFKEEYEADLHLAILSLHNELKHDQRFVVITDYKTLLAIDTKTGDKLDIALLNLPKHYDFFLPWAGMEKSQHQNENPADVKAAVNMAKLFDAIKKDNPDDSPAFIHGLNVFLSRLLFCFFAEDTHIFEEHQFTNAIDSHTQPDGSDLHDYLNTFFEVLNTPEDKRDDLPAYLNDFPYVNGGLFQDTLFAPHFTRASRAALLGSGDQDWAAINPDIFGSMFQAVISSDQRGTLGQHYTSVPNIMKVIEPLFLNDLHEAFDASTSPALSAQAKDKKLKDLLLRLEHIKIFDPACGSGNFLIIAYKELRKLEMAIIKEAQMMNFSRIHLSNFYGIEIDDFAHEIAKLALWLAEHQMNVEFKKEFGRTNPTLPLKEAGQIVRGNATRLDWEEVCPKEANSEVYILGNPPYLGTRNQDKSQKDDIDFVFQGFSKRRKLDYISNWFYLASKFCTNQHAAFSFVTTNSICQGEQVPLLWPLILSDLNEIIFAHTSFKWTNNAKSNAGVTVVIIGVSKIGTRKYKYLFSENQFLRTHSINPYLSSGKTLYIKGRTKPISQLIEMFRGNYTGCCNSLMLNDTERELLINDDKRSIKFLRPLIGSDELIKGKLRYCLWIKDEELEDALKIEGIKKRIKNVYQTRLESSDLGQQRIASRAHQFREFKEPIGISLIIPVVSSERRNYIPLDFVKESQIVPNSAQVIYNCEAYYFSLLSSTIHNLWVNTLAGKLENRIRYSSSICYNTFPFPIASTQRKNEITQCVFRILEEREKHPEKTLAQLYDPDKMPDGLREAHHQNDLTIERCYRSKPFESDEERLEYLFKLYEKMIQEEKDKGTLFAKAKKTRRKSKP